MSGMDKMRCRACGSALDANYSRCTYCGYNNKVLFTADADDSRAYRDQVLSKLTGFAVAVNRCKWDETADTLDTQPVVEPLFSRNITGLHLHQKTMTSPVWIAQFEGDKQVILVIHYKFSGRPKKVRATLTPTHGQVWYIGLKVDDSLHLTAYLGSSASKSIPLDLAE